MPTRSPDQDPADLDPPPVAEAFLQDMTIGSLLLMSVGRAGGLIPCREAITETNNERQLG